MKKLKLIPEKKEAEDNEVIEIHEEDIDMSFFENISPDSLSRATNNQIQILNNGIFEGRALRPTRVDMTFIMGKDELGDTIIVPVTKK